MDIYKITSGVFFIIILCLLLNNNIFKKVNGESIDKALKADIVNICNDYIENNLDVDLEGIDEPNIEKAFIVKYAGGVMQGGVTLQVNEKKMKVISAKHR